MPSGLFGMTASAEAESVAALATCSGAGLTDSCTGRANRRATVN
jgi:hypothetical protein